MIRADLTRVRDLRARLALNEVRRGGKWRRARQGGSRAGIAVATQYEQLAGASSESLAARLREGDGAVFSAEQASNCRLCHRRTSEGARGGDAVRRAKMQRDRAQAAADEARASYWREAQRRDTVYSKWQEEVKIHRALAARARDEARAGERVGANIALGRAENDEPAGSG